MTSNGVMPAPNLSNHLTNHTANNSSTQKISFDGMKFLYPTLLALQRSWTDTAPGQDYLCLSEITFEWGESYDGKDWVRLRRILAPTLKVSVQHRNNLSFPTSISTNKGYPGGLHRGERSQMGDYASRRVCGNHEPCRFRWRPACPHATPYRGFEMAKTVRR